MRCMTLDLFFYFSSADRGSSPAKHFFKMLRVLSAEPLKKSRDRRTENAPAFILQPLIQSEKRRIANTLSP